MHSHRDSVVFQLRVGASGRGLRAGHVRPAGTSLLVVLDNGEAGLVGLGLGRSKLGERNRGWCGLHGLGDVSQLCPPPCQPHTHLPTDQLAYSCFSHLMKRMSQNFPQWGAMDAHFANMRSLIQVRSAASGGEHGCALGWSLPT